MTRVQTAEVTRTGQSRRRAVLDAGAANGGAAGQGRRVELGLAVVGVGRVTLGRAVGVLVGRWLTVGVGNGVPVAVGEGANVDVGVGEPVGPEVVGGGVAVLVDVGPVPGDPAGGAAVLVDVGPPPDEPASGVAEGAAVLVPLVPGPDGSVLGDDVGDAVPGVGWPVVGRGPTPRSPRMS